MNNIFNGIRFLKVLRKDAISLGPQFAKMTVLLCGFWILAFLCLRFVLRVPYDDFQSMQGLILAGGFICCTLFIAPSLLYNKYNGKLKGVDFFMLPASQLEKFCAMFFYCVIVTPILSVLVFALLDAGTYPFYPWPEKTLWVSRLQLPNNTQLLSFFENMGYVFILQAALFFCNIRFQRGKVLKTAFILGAGILAVYLFSKLFDTVFPGLPAWMKTFDKGQQTYLAYESFHAIFDATLWASIKSYVLFLIVPVGLWIASFFKMKEQEL